MERPQLKSTLNFINVTNPVQSKSATNKKRVRTHVQNVYWKTRKDQFRTRSTAAPGLRPLQLRTLETSRRCECQALMRAEAEVATLHFPGCGGRVPLPRGLGSDVVRSSVVAQARGSPELNDFFSPDLVYSPTLGAGNHDPFSSFPMSTVEDSSTIGMLISNCKCRLLVVWNSV